MSKARELAELIGNAGGTSEQVLSGRRNWIINGDFQVSQRGDYVTSPVLVSGDNYSVDRWQHAGFSSHTIQVVNGYLRQSSTITGSNNFYTQQKVENFGKRFNGQTVTVSGKCNTNSSNLRLWVFQGSAWTIIGSITGDFSFTFQYTKQDGYDHMGLRFGVSDPSSPNVATSMVTGEYFELSEVQLELGSTATPFEHRSYGEELALCQRYYEVIDTLEIPQQGNYYANIRYLNPVTFKVEKRATPTVSYQQTGGWPNGVGQSMGVAVRTTSVQLTDASATNQMYAFILKLDAEL